AQRLGPARPTEIQNCQRPYGEDRRRPVPVTRGVLECGFGLANGHFVLAADRRDPGEEPTKQGRRIRRTKLACEPSSLDSKKLRFVKALLRDLVQGMRAENVDEDPDRALCSRE